MAIFENPVEKTYDLSELKRKVDEKLPPQAWTRVVIRVADLLEKKNLDLEKLLRPPKGFQVDKAIYVLFVKVIKITFRSNN